MPAEGVGNVRSSESLIVRPITLTISLVLAKLTSDSQTIGLLDYPTFGLSSRHRYKVGLLPFAHIPIPPFLPCPVLLLQVGSWLPLMQLRGVWGALYGASAGELVPKLNLVHFSLKIGPLVATILMILLRINWPNFCQFSIQLDVLSMDCRDNGAHRFA